MMGSISVKQCINVLDTFNICEKFFCCTTDNAKNNPTGLKELAKLLLQNKGIRWKVNEHHIRCLCHILNICVQAFLKTCRVLELEGPAAIDLHLNDVDDLDTPEMRAAHEAARTPAARNTIKEASKLFQEAMKLVREIGKVRSWCNTQFNLIESNYFNLCVTISISEDG